MVAGCSGLRKHELCALDEKHGMGRWDKSDRNPDITTNKKKKEPMTASPIGATIRVDKVMTSSLCDVGVHCESR